MIIYARLRRVVDVVCASLALLVLLPLSLPLVAALRLTGEGEVFYRQARIGIGGRQFQILKFATMLKDSVNLPGGKVTLMNDPRITPLGRFLRKSKVNELPQLWNILVGDMAIVGPRPQMQASFEFYSQSVRAILIRIRPGLTGIGSLVFRDEERFVSESGLDPVAFYRDVIFPYKGRLEIWYAEHVSPITDLKIVLLTVWSVLRPDSTACAFRWFKDLPLPPDELREINER